MHSLLFIIVSLFFIESQCLIKVDTNTSLFYDQFGRYTIFHGVNVVYKTDPFYPPNLESFDPQTSFCIQDVKNLKQWGFNLIRLHVAWEGAEPQRGKFNMTYLQQVQKIVQMCNQFNISVILDVHQDLYSKLFCGEGFPDWVMENQTFPDPFLYNISRDEKGYPNSTDCQKEIFFKYYFTYAVGENSEKIFTVENIAEDFANFWVTVVKFFKDESNIIGYEILNEPFGVSPYNHFVDFVWPGTQNDKYIMPFYRIVNQKIRQIDKEKLIFFEPATFDLFSGGFEENIGGPEYKDREVYSYHVYCGFQNRQGDPHWHYLCEKIDTYFFNGKYDNLRKLEIGGLLSEFGCLSNSEDSIRELNFVLKLAESKLQSWAYWQFKDYNDITTMAAPLVEGFYDKEGKLQKQKLKALTKPYASSICGKPILMKFDDQTQIFQLQFEVDDKGCQGQNTVIWINKMFYYPRGFTQDYQNCITCFLSQDQQYSNQFEILGVEKSLKKKEKKIIELTLKPKYLGAQ